MTVPIPKVIRERLDVVPAQPGFNLVFQVHGDRREVVDLWRKPILAWRIEERTYEHHDGHKHTLSTATPVTLGINCRLDDNVDWAVEYPDGRCDVPEDTMVDNAAELLKYWQEEQDARYRLADGLAARSVN